MISFHYFSHNFDMSNDLRTGDAPSRAPWTYADYENDRQFATTLARGLELMRCFSPQHALLSNKELAQRMRLPRATISRLVYTLMCMGYLAQDIDSGKYRLGSAVLSLGFPLLETFPIRQRARAGMLELVQQTGGTVAIAIRDRLDMVCIEVIRGSGRTGHPVDIGRTYPMCGTAMGRAYLVACSAQEREALLNQIQVKAPEQWDRHREGVADAFANYPHTGCCVSVGEVYADVQAVAVPLGRQERGELAAINASFQRRTLNKRWLLDVVAPKLIALARQLP